MDPPYTSRSPSCCKARTGTRRFQKQSPRLHTSCQIGHGSARKYPAGQGQVVWREWEPCLASGHWHLGELCSQGANLTSVPGRCCREGGLDSSEGPQPHQENTASFYHEPWAAVSLAHSPPAPSAPSPPSLTILEARDG